MRTIIKMILMCMALMGMATLVLADANPAPQQHPDAMTPDAIANRLKPVGSVDVEGASAAPAAAAAVTLSANAGEERYKSTCSVCHATGVAGAPKFRDAADWKSRVGAGIDGMLKIAIAGKGAMPPKGTCMQCSDEELRKTIEYMIPK